MWGCLVLLPVATAIIFLGMRASRGNNGYVPYLHSAIAAVQIIMALRELVRHEWCAALLNGIYAAASVYAALQWLENQVNRMVA